MWSRPLRFHLGGHDKRQDLSSSAGAVALRTAARRSRSHLAMLTAQGRGRRDHRRGHLVDGDSNGLTLTSRGAADIARRW
jgi:hypothetical protein